MILYFYFIYLFEKKTNLFFYCTFFSKIAVVTMTPESHKRVFAVYPEGEQQPFLLQSKDQVFSIDFF